MYAALYDLLARAAEPRLAPLRQRTAGRARGATLEIGAGTGANLPFYPPGVRLAVVEPNPAMARRLRRRAERLGRSVDIVVQAGEALPFADESFDTVVATLVLCSVRDPAAVLREIRRVLRPPSQGREGGAFLFFEHVAARDERLRRWQRRLTPCWRLVADGCHLDRETGAAVRAAEFRRVEIEPIQLPVGPAVARPAIVGRALA